MYVGVDVGATFIRVGLVDDDGKVVARVKLRQPEAGDEYSVANVVIDAIDRVSMGRGIEGIGIGSIGPLRLATGDVVNTPNASIKSFKLVEPLVKRYRVPVVLANDAAAAAWGEHIFGIGRGVGNMVYLAIGTGIGAGVIVDGNLLVGKDGNAHEVGHLVLDHGSTLPCGCGGLGHWEGLASGANIPRAFREYLRSRGLDAQATVPMSTEEIFRHYYLGNELVRAFIDDYLMRINAAGLASVMNAYDPELVVLGGSVVLGNAEVFLRGIRKYLGLFLMVREAEVKITGFGDDAVVVGAAALVKKMPSALEPFVNAYLKQYGGSP